MRKVGRGKNFLPSNVRCLHPVPMATTPLEYHESKLLLYTTPEREKRKEKGQKARLNTICKKGSTHNAMGRRYCAVLYHNFPLSHNIIRSCNLASSARTRYLNRTKCVEISSTSFRFGISEGKRPLGENIDVDGRIILK
jgi:hypothetical protein